MYRHILVPTDGSIVSARAERAAIAVAKRFKAKVTAVHVMPPYSPQALGDIGGQGPPPLSPEQYRALAEKRGNAALRRVAMRARRAKLGFDRVLVTGRDPGEEVVRAARAGGCDLIVMGSTSRAGIERIFLGSVASDVLNGTQIPALICH